MLRLIKAPKMSDSYALSCNDSLSCKYAVCTVSRMAWEFSLIDDILEEHAIEPTAEFQSCIGMGHGCSRRAPYESDF